MLKFEGQNRRNHK